MRRTVPALGVGTTEEGKLRRRLLFAVSSVVVAAAGLFGQGPQPASFDVASVRPSQIGKAGGEGNRRENIQAEPGSLIMRNVSLASCIQWAYNAKQYQVSGPGWIREERYDIAAKTEDPVPIDQLRLMLRVLLAERFQLALHEQVKELSAYALVVAKNGPKLQPSEGEGEPGIQGGKLHIAVQRMPLAQFADYVSGALQTPVLDMTGLTGRFDFNVDLTPYLASYLQERKPGDPPPDLTAIAMTALPEQLGLKLEARKAPVELFIVDRAEKVPAEN